jgi:fatty-acyl-CoA synthase
VDAGYRVFDIVDRVASTSAGRDRVAITCGGEDRSFGQLRDRARALAGGLRKLGIAPGEKVAVLMGNRHEWPELLFGITAAGGVCVPVNVLLRGNEIAHVLRDSEAVALVVDSLAEGALGELEQLPPLLIAVGEVEAPAAAAATPYEELIERGGDGGELELPGRLDPAMIYYTSGTTGLPKGAVHAHEGLIWNTLHQMHDLGIEPDDVYVVVPSLSWAAGFHDVMLPAMWCGGRSVLLPTGGATLEGIVTAIEDNGGTRALLVPTLLKQLLDAPELLERLRHSTLRWVMTGAEPIAGSVLAALNEELPDCPIVQAFGMSEFPLISAILRPEEAVAHAGKAGRATSASSIAVETPEGEITDRGAGEILIRSPALMIGYHNRPEATAEAFARGWFHTGDVGEIDAGGFLAVTGRKKDMIISGGMNIYPREIEDVLIRAEGVVEAAVVGVPDEKWGERPVAVVVSEDDGVESRVLALCEAELSSYKRPRTVLVRGEALPRTPTGKVLKRDLRPWAARELGVG